MAGTNPITSWIKACMETYQGREEWMEGASPERGERRAWREGYSFSPFGAASVLFLLLRYQPAVAPMSFSRTSLSPSCSALVNPPPPPMTLLYPDSSLPAPDDTAPPPPSRALFFCDIGPFTPFVDKLARGSRLPQRPHCRVSKRLDY